MFNSITAMAQIESLPCETDFNGEGSNTCTPVPWAGPYSATYTATDFTPALTYCSSTCTFVIEYYERHVTCENTNVNYFDVQMTEIVYSDGCYDCVFNNKDEIIKKLLIDRFNDVANLFQDKWGSCVNKHHRVTVGACFNDLGGGVLQKCSQDFCCATWLEVCYDENGNVTSMTDDGNTLYTNGVPIDCSHPLIGCPDAIIMCDLNLSTMLCDIPCDEGPWIDKTEDIEFYPLNCKDGNGNPICTLTVNYSHRLSDCEGLTFKDFKINNIEYSPACSTCLYWDDLQVFQYTMDYLIKNGDFPTPLPGDVEENWRFIMSPCWRDYWNQYNPCPEEYCCMYRYKVTGTGGDPLTEIIENSGYLVTCKDPECRAICGEFPYRKPFIDNRENTKSNINILYHYNEKSISVNIENLKKGDYLLQLFDIKGKVLLNESINITSAYYSKTYQHDKLKSGAYFFTISGKKDILFSKKLTIVW